MPIVYCCDGSASEGGDHAVWKRDRLHNFECKWDTVFVSCKHTFSFVVLVAYKCWLRCIRRIPLRSWYPLESSAKFFPHLCKENRTHFVLDVPEAMLKCILFQDGLVDGACDSKSVGQFNAAGLSLAKQVFFTEWIIILVICLLPVTWSCNLTSNIAPGEGSNYTKSGASLCSNNVIQILKIGLWCSENQYSECTVKCSKLWSCIREFTCICANWALKVFVLLNGLKSTELTRGGMVKTGKGMHLKRCFWYSMDLCMMNSCSL